MAKPSDKGTILVVDDEANIRRALQMTLENEGYGVHVCDSPLSAYRLLVDRTFTLAILDIRMGEISGMDLFEKMRGDGVTVPVIFISGNATLSEAVRASKLGAYDFIEKPFGADKLRLTVERCLEHEELKRRVAELSRTPETRGKFVGRSEGADRILRDVAKVAPTSATVLIQGESGTGKELVAQMIHDLSDRKSRPFIKVNCSAIPENLIESELFGYERGAFTGAQSAKRGFFEQANGGTLFLDEIGDMSMNAQSKVLRALQNSEIQKLGSERIQRVDVRVVAATHRDLEREVREGGFREDLYYRVSVVPIRTTPLRDRREDIPLLANWFATTYAAANNLKERAIGEEVLDELAEYPWPGNIRELQNLTERLLIMGGDPIRREDLPAPYQARSRLDPESTGFNGLTWKEFRERSERSHLLWALRRTNGNVSEAATILEIERTYLHKKIAQYGIQKREYFL